MSYKDKVDILSRDDLKKCDKCGGTGKMLKLNIKKAKNEMVTCDKCKGIGFEQPEGTKGFYIESVPGAANWIYWYTDKEERAANMFVLIRGIARSPQDPDKYLVVYIHSMFTAEKFRGKGYMDKLLASLQNLQSKLVKFITTSYGDSTKEGRAFLTKRGFLKEGDVLIWRRDGKQS